MVGGWSPQAGGHSGGLSSQSLVHGPPDEDLLLYLVSKRFEDQHLGSPPSLVCCLHPFHRLAESGQSQPEPWVVNRPHPPRACEEDQRDNVQGGGLSTAFREASGWGAGAFLTPGDPSLREETHIDSQEPPAWRDIQRPALRSPQPPAGRDSPAFTNIQSDRGFQSSLGSGALRERPGTAEGTLVPAYHTDLRSHRPNRDRW